MVLYVGLILSNLIVGYFLKEFRFKSWKKLHCIFITVICIFFAAFRKYTVGADTKQFVLIFDSIVGSNCNYIQFKNSRIEPGFFYLCKILGLISHDWQILIAFCSLFSLAVLGWFIYRNSKNTILSYSLFIGFQYYAFWLTAMRQIIAISIILIAFENFLKKKKIIPFLIFVVLATLFHRSAIICILFWPFYMVRDKKILYTVSASVAFFLLFSRDLFLWIVNTFNYSAYIGSEFDSSNFFAAVIKFILSLIFFIFSAFCLWKKEDETKKPNNDMQKFLLLSGFISALLSLVSIQVTLFERVGQYFNYFCILLLPNVLFERRVKNQRWLVALSLHILSVLYCAIVLTYRPEWSYVVPYSFFWN